MFREAIFETPLVNEDVLGCFKINSVSFRGDSTLTSTLRALCPEEKINLSIEQMRTSDVHENYCVDYADGMCPDSLAVIQYQSVGTDVPKQMERANERIPSLDGWERVERASKFFENTVPVSVFVNRSDRKSLIVTGRLTVQKFHYLQVGIFAYLPWYFSRETVTETQLGVIKALQADTPDEYLRLLGEIAQGLGLEEKRVRGILSGIGEKIYETEINRVTEQIASYDADVSSLLERVRGRLRNKNEAMIRLKGLRETAKEYNEDELVDIFTSHKNLRIKELSGCTMIYDVISEIEIFDEDIADGFISDHGTSIYDRVPSDMESELEAVLRAIFVDKKCKLIASGQFMLEFGVGLTARSGFGISDFMHDAMPNTHLYEYGCAGGYNEKFAQLITRGNYAMAIEQSIASVATYNFSDPTVMAKFGYYLASCIRDESAPHCILMPDGRRIGIYDLCKELKESKGE